MAAKKQQDGDEAIQLFTAGGAVRDLLLGRPLRDADYVFAASEEAFILRNPAARKTQGGDHPVYLLHGQEYCPLPPGLPLAEALRRDLFRRDFTMNALLLSLDGVLHCHPMSLTDLKERRIRPASPHSLADSPVRALRAARFAATLPGFSPHRETLEQMRALAVPEYGPDTGSRSPLAGIAAEQAGRETLKACAGDRPGEFLRVLRGGGCLRPWLEEFCRADAIPAGPPAFHDASVLEHTARVMDAVAAQCRPPAPPPGDKQERVLAVWMALCHDIGKTSTPADMLPSHHGHDARGEELARALGQRLRLPSLFIKAGMLSSRLHMKAAGYRRLRPGTRVDLLMTLHTAHLFRPFARMAAVDAGQPDLPERMRRDLERILAVGLPRERRGMGRASGQHLRDLRCMAVTGRRAGSS